MSTGAIEDGGANNTTSAGEVQIHFIVYPAKAAEKSSPRFSLSLSPNLTGVEVKKRLKAASTFKSRWIQLVHNGKVLTDHETLRDSLAYPRNKCLKRDTNHTLVVIPTPERLQARHNWWIMQERELTQESIANALGDASWPPLFVIGQTPQSHAFTHRHEVWMRRIAQLSSLSVVELVPRPCFIQDDELPQKPIDQMDEERNFALNEVIASWEESGWQLREGVQKIWVRWNFVTCSSRGILFFDRTASTTLHAGW